MLFLLRLSYNLMKYGSTKNATSITKVNCKVKTRFAKYKKNVYSECGYQNLTVSYMNKYLNFELKMDPKNIDFEID